MAIDVKSLQHSNAQSPMVVTELGIVIDFSLKHIEKQLLVISVVPSFIIILVPSGISPLYLYATEPAYTNPSGWLLNHGVLWNALWPMVVTEEGIDIEVRLVQSQNASRPIDLTELGMITEPSELQSANTPSPRVMTELGMVIEVSPSHLMNAPPSMVVTELGISNDVKLWHP